MEFSASESTNANINQSERQSDGSRDESEEPASYDDDHLEYGDENDGERHSLSLRQAGLQETNEIINRLSGFACSSRWS